MFQSRTYRKEMGGSRFTSFVLAVGESDLWIGYTPALVAIDQVRSEAAHTLRRLRNEILTFPDPTFLTSLVPLAEGNLPCSPFLSGMLQAARLSHTGPMASVAGAIAQEVGRHLKERFCLDEVVVENGGDLYIDILKELSVTLYAGDNSLSGKVSIVVDPFHSPIGVCTSSAKIGHSTSFGKADAVMVACKDAALADGYATSYCNKVETEDDVQVICNEMNAQGQILSALVLLDTKLALCGQLEVRTQA